MNLELAWDPYDDSLAMGFLNILELAPLLEELEQYEKTSRFVYCTPHIGRHHLHIIYITILDNQGR